MVKQFKSGTAVKNARQISVLSVDEMSEISKTMGIPSLRAEWVGAKLATAGIPDLSPLPPSTKLQFASGATIVMDIENLPCRYPAAIIEIHRPEHALGFVKSAKNKRGVVGWNEAKGIIQKGDPISLWIPPQRKHVHA